MQYNTNNYLFISKVSINVLLVVYISGNKVSLLSLTFSRHPLVSIFHLPKHTEISAFKKFLIIADFRFISLEIISEYIHVCLIRCIVDTFINI